MISVQIFEVEFCEDMELMEPQKIKLQNGDWGLKIFGLTAGCKLLFASKAVRHVAET